MFKVLFNEVEFMSKLSARVAVLVSAVGSIDAPTVCPGRTEINGSLPVGPIGGLLAGCRAARLPTGVMYILRHSNETLFSQRRGLSLEVQIAIILHV